MPDATAPESPQQDGAQLFKDLPRRQRRKLILGGLLWTVATVAVITTAYFIAPLDAKASVVSILELSLCGLAIVVIMGWQIWRITRSDYPTIRAVEALAFIVPAYLVFFAATYFLMNHANPATFGTSVTKLDSLYFSTTVFTTVGFGDIVAKTQAGRAVVLCQMILDLVILGLVTRLVINAVRVSKQRGSE